MAASGASGGSPPGNGRHRTLPRPQTGGIGRPSQPDGKPDGRTRLGHSRPRFHQPFPGNRGDVLPHHHLERTAMTPPVLHMLPDLALGGGQIMLLRTVSALRERGGEHLVCALRGGPCEADFRNAGIPILVAGLDGKHRAAGAFRRALKFAAEAKVGIVHTNSTPIGSGVRPDAGAQAGRAGGQYLPRHAAGMDRLSAPPSRNSGVPETKEPCCRRTGC